MRTHTYNQGVADFRARVVRTVKEMAKAKAWVKDTGEPGTKLGPWTSIPRFDKPTLDYLLKSLKGSAARAAKRPGGAGRK